MPAPLRMGLCYDGSPTYTGIFILQTTMLLPGYGVSWICLGFAARNTEALTLRVNSTLYGLQWRHGIIGHD